MNLRDTRERYGLTCAYMATLFDVAESTYRSYEARDSKDLPLPGAARALREYILADLSKRNALSSRSGGDEGEDSNFG